MNRTRIALAFLVAALAVTSVMAQQTGGIKIVVKDEAGPLPGATVTLSNDQGKIKTTTLITNKDGEVRFPVLMVGGGYSVDVAFPGKTPQRRDFSVKVRESPTLEVVLAAEFKEVVQVTAKTEVVDLEKTESTTQFTEEFIDDLPVPGRFYQNVLTLAPGVQDPDGDGNPIVHGSRARDFKTSVGGIANVDPLTGQQLANVNPNSIEEMEVVTAGAGPEYRRAQGGYANIIQKQGGNSHEGVVDFIFRSSALDGDGATNRQAELTPEFETLQPSVQFTGPLIRDRLWYRLSHEYLAQDNPVDTGASLEVIETTQEINSDQITWQVSDRNKLAFKWDANPVDVKNQGVSTLRPASAAFNIENERDTYSIQWSAPYSPSLFVDTVVGYQDAGLSFGPTTDGLPNTCIKGSPLFENAQCFNAETTEISGSFNRRFSDDRQRFTLNSEGTYFLNRKLLGMEHSLKFGLSIENERYFRNDINGPTIFFFEFSPLGDGDEGGQEDIEPIGIVVASFSIPREDSAKATGNTWGIFFRDDMKPRNNMTITWGFGVDRETVNTTGFTPLDPEAEYANFVTIKEQLLAAGVPEDAAIRDARVQAFTIYEGMEAFRTQLGRELNLRPADIGTFFGAITAQSAFQDQKRRAEDLSLVNTNFAPYLAFNWDPWNNNKTRIGFTIGRKYNNIPFAIPMTEQVNLRASIGATAERIGTEWFINDIAARQKINPAASLQTVRRDLKTPYNDEITATFERELWSESSVRVQYINRKFRDQLQDIDINNIPGDFGTCLTAVNPGDPAIDFSEQDGIIDDCTGEFLLLEPGPGEEADPFNPNGRIERPDGVPDLYKLNPFWGPIFEIGNNNRADYDSFVLEFNRRLYRGWQMTGSYTWSMARGNGEDFGQQIGDDQSLVDDEFGFQSTDQRHVVKLSATTVTPWGFRLGGSASWQSGLPYSILDSIISYDTTIPELGNFGTSEPRQRLLYPTGSRNDQRNASWWNFDMKATKDLRIGKRINGMVSLEVYNLLNDGTYSVYNPFLSIGRQINGVNEARRRFGRRFQLQTSFSF